MKAILTAATLIAAMAGISPAFAGVGDPVVVNSSGDVIATFDGSDAGFHSTLGLVGGPDLIFDNRSSSVGDTVDLGSFSPGTVLTFSLHVLDEQETFFSGPAALNPDGVAHANVTSDALGTLVGFEDASGGGDRDYNDLNFSFSNTTNVPISAAPEPSTWALMLGGVGILGGMLRIAGARRREDEATGMSAA